jgi:hypothetical protein
MGERRYSSWIGESVSLGRSSKSTIDLRRRWMVDVPDTKKAGVSECSRVCERSKEMGLILDANAGEVGVATCGSLGSASNWPSSERRGAFIGSWGGNTVAESVPLIRGYSNSVSAFSERCSYRVGVGLGNLNSDGERRGWSSPLAMVDGLLCRRFVVIVFSAASTVPRRVRKNP